MEADDWLESRLSGLLVESRQHCPCHPCHPVPRRGSPLVSQVAHLAPKVVHYVLWWSHIWCLGLDSAEVLMSHLLVSLVASHWVYQTLHFLWLLQLSMDLWLGRWYPEHQWPVFSQVPLLGALLVYLDGHLVLCMPAPLHLWGHHQSWIIRCSYHTIASSRCASRAQLVAWACL